MKTRRTAGDETVEQTEKRIAANIAKLPMLKSKFNLLNLYLIVLASRRFYFQLEQKTSHNSALGVSASVIRTTGCNAMRLTTLAVATPLVLASATVATAAMAFGNGSLGSNQSVHGPFGQHVHKRPHNRFVLPYPYYDYDYPADAFGEPPTYPPPVVSSVPPAPPSPPCQRSVEKFTVPSQDGGTKQITIINCP